MEPTASNDRQTDIAACLEAVSMYNADYHRDRDNYKPSVPQFQPQIVPIWQYLWGMFVKSSTSLLGQILLVGVCTGVVLILANCARNFYDVDRAQPVVRTEIRIDLKTKKPYEFTWTEKSLYPLTDGYAQSNLNIYALLLSSTALCYAASRFSLRRARQINVGVPLTYANTAHLPAVETLVRASVEPTQVQATALLRAGVMPTHSAQLVRPATYGAGQHEEQLLRTSAGQE